jgi:hypothetical protein
MATKTLKQCKIPGCLGQHKGKGYCSKHHQRVLRHGHANVTRQYWAEGRRLSKSGYIYIGKELEHRLVMEEHLNRVLKTHENIHHINGNRQDNRLSNLELWNTQQPSGQRVEDKVTWAKDILEENNYYVSEPVDIFQLYREGALS